MGKPHAHGVEQDRLKKIQAVEKREPKWKRIQVKPNIEGDKVDGLTHILVKQTPSDPLHPST